MTSTDSQQSRLASRIERLCSDDRQFAAARPSQTVGEAAGRPGLRLPQIVRTVMEGYADRPALGQRTSRLVTDPATGRTSTELLPGFDTMTYRQIWDRIVAIATALHDEVRPGDRVALLGFGSIDYTTLDMAVIHLGAVSLPLQATASHDRLRPIVAETRPALIAASLDSLADAVELALTGHTPARLVVFDYHPGVDDQREAFAAARARLAQSPVALESLTEVIERGRRLPPVPERVSADPDPLSLLLYTSGSTGEPKGAMYTERLVANTWRGATKSTGALPVITLGFMPMSHRMGRLLLISALGNGGTCYFAATSDLSTLLEDLALVRPTRLDFVPRV